jgi:synaptojanin
VFGETFERAIKSREKEFADYQEVNLFVVSWNVAGFTPSSSFDMTNLLNFEDHNAPDVLVFGLQEYIELSTKNVMSSSTDPQKIAAWKDLILSNLKRFGDYLFVKEQSLVGLLIIIIAREDIANRISKVNTDYVKTGFVGQMGNKGAVLVKLNIDDSSFCFLNSHLEAGSKGNNSRILNLIDIHNRGFQQGGVGKKKVIRGNLSNSIG